VKVLIAASDLVARKRMAAWITAAGHAVTEAENTAGACGLLDRQPEIVVVDWLLPGGGGAAMIKHLRAVGITHRHYVIVMCVHPQPQDITAIFGAGAEDFVLAKVSREELLARIDGLTRARAWATRGKPLDLATVFDLETLQVWRGLDAIVTAEVGEMLGTHFNCEAPRDAKIRWAGTVPLSLSAEQLELRIGVGLELSASDVFTKEVLGGDTTSDALSDALREIANVAGGAIKRAALGEGVAITIGLPSNESIFSAPNARRWSVTNAAGLRVTFAAVAVACQHRPVTRSALREGMVIATDLTVTTAEHLSRLLDANVYIDVTETVSLTADRGHRLVS
jgi:DNA-binding response OmpR family regulator